MVDFVEASPLRYALTFKPTIYVSHIRQFWSTVRIETTEEGTQILTTVDGVLRTITESSLRRNLKLHDEEGINSLPDTELFENLTLMGYNISPNQKFTFQKGSETPTEPHHTPSQEAQPSSHIHISSPSIPNVTYVPTILIRTATPSKTTPIRKYTRRHRIAQSSVLPPAADEPASRLRDVTPTVTSPAADEDNMQHTIPELTALLREGVVATNYGDDAPIKGRSMDEGEATIERVTDDTEEMETVLTSIDAATILASAVVDVPTGSESIPTASTPSEGSVPTGSEEVPTASLVFATTNVVARELKEQLAREDQRRAEQIARDAEIARIHAEEELQNMIDGLDSNNETVAKYLEEYHNYTKVYKFQSQQRKSRTKKQKRDYYMAVIRNNLGWKVKDFKGMTFEEVETKFNSVCKQMEDFIPMGSKEEAVRIKRKGINLEQESAKKQKSKKEITKEAKSPEEVTEEKIKEMMQLVPIEEVYVEALQNFMHAPAEWKLYEKCGVHQLISKDKDIFILVEKDYPIKKGLALVMICYKLQVENYSHMAEDLVRKIYNIANSPRQQGD
nr:hypothetical protein [Tanacetum cinerariifolium]